VSHMKPTLSNTFEVVWSEQDGEFVGRCVDFPSLSWLAATQEEALRGIRALVAEVIADLAKEAKSPSEPQR
jgi:predicted RNase H-like HicB family nuclease